MTDMAVWRAVTAATGTGDRAVAEEGIALAYRRAGLAAPERVVWVRSPREAVQVLMGAAGPDGAPVGETGASVRDAVLSRPWAAERDLLHRQLGPQGWSGHWNATGAGLWESTRVLVDRVRAGVVESSATGREEIGRASCRERV